MRHLGLLLLCVLLSRALPAAEPLTVYYHERPPYAQTQVGGEVSGLTATPAAEVLREAQIPFRWERLPAKRQAQVVEDNRERACMLGWFSTPERRAAGRFSAPLYQDRPMIVLTRAGHPVLSRDNLTTADILGDRRLKALLKDSYSYGEYLDRLISTLAPTRELTVAENDAMLLMLVRERADYLFITEEEANHLLSLQKLAPAGFRFIRPPDMPAGSTRHLWCTRLVEESTLRAIDAALAPRARRP